MKKYLASIIGVTAFASFVMYATIQTKAEEKQALLAQTGAQTENIETPLNTTITLPILPTSPIKKTNKPDTEQNPAYNTVAPVITEPIITAPKNTDEDTKYSSKDEDEDEDDDDDD
jgi:hypothetical protein